MLEMIHSMHHWTFKVSGYRTEFIAEKIRNRMPYAFHRGYWQIEKTLDNTLEMIKIFPGYDHEILEVCTPSDYSIAQAASI